MSNWICILGDSSLRSVLLFYPLDFLEGQIWEHCDRICLLEIFPLSSGMAAGTGWGWDGGLEVGRLVEVVGKRSGGLNQDFLRGSAW